MHDALVENLGDHKWLVKIFSEKDDPASFNTSEEEFDTRFLCSYKCVCSGEGDCDADDCDCMFSIPQIGLQIQYNVKMGELDQNMIEEVVAEVGKKLDLEEKFPVIKVVPFGRKTKNEGMPTFLTNVATGKLEALLGKGLSEEEIIRRVLFSVRDSLPAKGTSRENISQVVDAWVKR